MDSKIKSKCLVIQEGTLHKQGNFLKNWSKKYFLLNKQSLVYFRKEQTVDSCSSEGTPQGRIFLSDMLKIDCEEEDRKKCQFTIVTKKHRVRLQASSGEEVDSWIKSIHAATKSEGEAEAKDPFRRSLRKLAPGLKRVTLTKDPMKGIGCTIKSAAGHIFVNAIVEDGPIAFTGVLRPDDELLEVNGISLKGMSVSEVGGVIRSCASEFIATVRPVSALKKYRRDAPKGSYATRMGNISTFTPPVSPTHHKPPTTSLQGHAPSTLASRDHSATPPPPQNSAPKLEIRPPTPEHAPNHTSSTPSPPDSPLPVAMSDEGSLGSYDDMGDYDDDDIES